MKISYQSSSSSLSSLLAAIVTTAVFIVTPSLASNAACELGQDCFAIKVRNAARISSIIGNETVAVVVSPKVVDVLDTNDDDSSARSSSGLPRIIQYFQQYLENPSQHLQEMKIEGESDSSNHLWILLEDLEEQFSRPDSDTAQELYSLGGWPILASLVSPLVHHSNNYSSNNINDSMDVVVDKILAIRAAAAAAMGTAVKDREEFHPWVLEEIKLDGSATTTTTPLDLVVESLVEVIDAARVPSNCNETTLYFQEHLAKESIVALKSFLHGNRQAQIVFSTKSMNGSCANALGRQAAIWTQEAATTAASKISSNVPMSRNAIEMTRSLLSLADCIVAENQEDTTDVVEVFSTSDWCVSAIKAATLSPSSYFKRLVLNPLQTTALVSPFFQK